MGPDWASTAFKGVTFSEPGENSVAVSYTSSCPCSRPTNNRESLHANAMKLAFPGVDIVLLGVKISSLSSFAVFSVDRNSSSGEKIRAISC